MKCEKYCLNCGKRLERRKLSRGDYESWKQFENKKYCDRNCMKEAFRKKKKKTQEEITIRTSRKRASDLIVSTTCDICGKKNAIDVHHIDENPKNNSLDNLQRLCRSCHLKKHRKQKGCSIKGCTSKHKGLGYCDKHY